MRGGIRGRYGGEDYSRRQRTQIIFLPFLYVVFKGRVSYIRRRISESSQRGPRAFNKIKSFLHLFPLGRPQYEIE